MRPCFNEPQPAPKPHTVCLAQGGQAVINGAIITASTACTLEVGSGAFVLTGRSLWRASGPARSTARNPSEELYFSLLDASASSKIHEDELFRLFALLAQVVTQQRTHEAQQECALCASALIAGNTEDATRSAARLASGRLKSSGKLPGQISNPHKRRSEMQIQCTSQIQCRS